MSSLYFRFEALGGKAEASPLLSRLLARADGPTAVTDWRAQACAADESFAVGPIALFAAHGRLEGGFTCVATPVHYSVEMSNVRLGRGGILRLDATAAVALATDFNQVWRDSGITMRVGKYADLFCIFDATLSVTTCDPQAVLDRHIDEQLPQGADAPRLRRLMSEMEMWLFEHKATRVARSHSARPVNGLWLWGGGALRATPAELQVTSAGEDPLFNYYAGDVTHGGVIVAPLPGSEAWEVAQAQWLAPAVAGLKAGKFERLLLSAADRCYALRAASLRRFWRRDSLWSTRFA